MADTAVLIYDEECSLCCGCMKWLKLHAIANDAFEIIPCRSKKRMSLFPGLNEQACLEKSHMVLPDGQILTGDETLPEILIRLRYFRWLAVLFRIPVIRLLSYAVYRLIANNRYIISKTILPLTEEKI
ncbi:MAG: thiol-disulfide oxidoreductase DCC family protein [Candidatus Scalindua sp.]